MFPSHYQIFQKAQKKPWTTKDFSLHFRPVSNNIDNLLQFLATTDIHPPILRTFAVAKVLPLDHTIKTSLLYRARLNVPLQRVRKRKPTGWKSGVNTLRNSIEHSALSAGRGNYWNNGQTDDCQEIKVAAIPRNKKQSNEVWKQDEGDCRNQGRQYG